MKRVLLSMLIAIFLVSCESLAHATEVQIYDYSVENIISDLKTLGRQKGVDIWGTEYYTYKGVKRCELNFGDSKRNIIRFRLNNDNSVSRILVTVPNNGFSESSMEAGFMLGVILYRLGLSESEFKNLWGNYMHGVVDLINQNPYATHFHEKYTVWCSKTQRYMTLDVELNTSKMDYYLYASI